MDKEQVGDPSRAGEARRSERATVRLMRTPSQTVGPFFASALPWPDGPYVVPEGTAGAVWLRGRVLDGAGDAVPDALIETWQVDGEGRAAETASSATFRGFGRCPTDANGEYAILTVLPAAAADVEGAASASHLAMAVFGRGLLKPVWTRVYFEGQAANADDPLLAVVDDPQRRATLIAERTGDGYRFDVRLQGERETVFFDF